MVNRTRCSADRTLVESSLGVVPVGSVVGLFAVLHRLGEKMQHVLLFSVLSLLSGCDAIKEILGDTLETCTLGCARVQECGASPPVPVYGLAGGQSSGIEGLDCAAGCADEERAKIGYADCQLECIESVECGSMQGCWDAGSAVFGEYCGSGGADVKPPDGETYDNGSVTGNEAVDSAVDNPAVKDAVEESGFTLNFGDSPPAMDDGVFYLDWVIIDQNNARPVGFGNPHDICLWESDVDPDADWGFCQIDGLSLGLHLIGKDDMFTFVIVDDMYHGYISGRVAAGDSGTRLVDVETLWVLLWGPEMWEKQTWTADWVDDIDQCQSIVSDYCPV
jgi:hypothetical protein